MQAKKIVCFFVVLLLVLGLGHKVEASSTSTVSLYGVRLTVDLIFPDEAHPNESIWHNATMTANTNLFLRNLTVVIEAPVNSGWQEVFTLKDDQIARFIPENSSYQWFSGPILLPQETNGKLRCFMYVNTSQSTDYASFSVYTTLVSEPTFSEMQILYEEMLANYTSLQEDYGTLLDDYDSLLADYSSLSADYTALLSEYDTLADQYSELNETHQALVNEHNGLSYDYNTLERDWKTLDNDLRSTTNELRGLQSKYESLNSTRNSLQANYTSLQANYTSLQEDYDALNEDYSDLLTQREILQESKDSALNTDRIIMIVFIVAVAALVTFIVYLKRKKEQPYVVIRKETVSMKPDEKT